MKGAELLDDSELIVALKQRDERAFVALVKRYQGSLIRLALVYAKSHAVAEEIVQETWLGVLQGLDRFERRSAFKTWLFRILVNRARTRATRENRMVQLSELAEAGESSQSAVAPERFLGADHPEWPHHWAVPPRQWGHSPEEELLTRETLDLVHRAISALPPSQQQVITLRDLDGLTSQEVCNVLDISETNQRVLLHRARSSVRGALERYFDSR